MNYLPTDDGFHHTMERRTHGVAMVANMTDLSHEITGLNRQLQPADIARFQTTLGHGIDDINYLTNEGIDRPDVIIILSCVKSAIECTSRLRTILSDNDFRAFRQYDVIYRTFKSVFDLLEQNLGLNGFSRRERDTSIAG